MNSLSKTALTTGSRGDGLLPLAGTGWITKEQRDNYERATNMKMYNDGGMIIQDAIDMYDGLVHDDFMDLNMAQSVYWDDGSPAKVWDHHTPAYWDDAANTAADTVSGVRRIKEAIMFDFTISKEMYDMLVPYRSLYHIEPAA